MSLSFFNNTAVLKLANALMLVISSFVSPRCHCGAFLSLFNGFLECNVFNVFDETDENDVDGFVTIDDEDVIVMLFDGVCVFDSSLSSLYGRFVPFRKTGFVTDVTPYSVNPNEHVIFLILELSFDDCSSAC